MKKLLLAICLVGLAQFVNAQCVPNLSETTPGMYPAFIPDQCVNTVVNEKVDIVFPDDTTLFGFTVPFDSFEVISVTGEPNGMTHVCHNPECKIIATPGGVSHGCIQMIGTPTEPIDSGDVVVQIRFYFQYAGSPQEYIALYGLNWRILPESHVSCGGVGTRENVEAKFGIELYPQPVSTEGYVRLELEETTHVEASLFDLSGKLVTQVFEGKLGHGEQTLNYSVENASQSALLLKIQLTNSSGSYTSGSLITLE